MPIWLSPLYAAWGECVAHIQGEPSHVSYPSLEIPLQTGPGVCFLGGCRLCQINSPILTTTAFTGALPVCFHLSMVEAVVGRIVSYALENPHQRVAQLWEP